MPSEASRSEDAPSPESLHEQEKQGTAARTSRRDMVASYTSTFVYCCRNKTQSWPESSEQELLQLHQAKDVLRQTTHFQKRLYQTIRKDKRALSFPGAPDEVALAQPSNPFVGSWERRDRHVAKL